MAGPLQPDRQLATLEAALSSVKPREHLVVTPAWAARVNARGLATMQAAYRPDLGKRVARSGTTDVVQIAGPPSDPSIWFLKRYWHPTMGRRLQAMFRGTFFGHSKVRREFDMLQALRAARIDAAEPIAYGEERQAGFLTRSFLLTEGIVNAQPLPTYLRRQCATPRNPDQRADRRTLLCALASAIRRLHHQGFLHHDLFWRNIILSGNSLDRFFLIDVHKTRAQSHPLALAQAAEDLASLDAAAPWFFHRTDRLRLYLAYVGRTRLTPEDRTVVRHVLALADPMRVWQLQRIIGRARPHHPHPTLLRPIPEFKARRA